MTIETIIWLIPLPPLAAFALIVLFTRRSHIVSHTIAVGAALLSFLMSITVFSAALYTEGLGKDPFASAINWLPTGDTWLRIGVMVDPLTAVTLFFVSITILMIFVYSVGYHNYGQPKGEHDKPGLPPHGAALKDEHGHTHKVPSVEPMYSRFFAFIGLFAFGMYTLVVSDNLLTLFVGWEIMGLCSYLLIGFWYQKPSARAAAIKAFMTTRAGDVFMLLGVAYLYSATGTLSFRAIFTEETLKTLAATPAVGGFMGLSAAGLIGILLLIGTIGKSAQFPLHVWLPDAMEGPTPVSAMIHAATMVSAGVYMVIRLFPLLSAGWVEGTVHNIPLIILALIGAFTAFMAATVAVAQNDIKRVLAYSTISQLGYMIAALGVGAYVAAAFHLITHAFFKALLFLGSGSVIHGVEHGVLHTDDHVDPQNMFNMGGLGKKMPVTFWTFVIGGFSLAGFPLLTAGFWSKDEILGEAIAQGLNYGSRLGWLVFIFLALAAFLTAFYTMRQITLTFLGQPRTKAAEHASENNWTMVLPLVVLAVFAISAGWVGIPGDFMGLSLPESWFHEFVGSTLTELPKTVAFNWFPLLTSVVVSLGGLALGWLVYKDVPAGAEDPLKVALGPVYKVLQNKYYVDEAYNYFLVRPATWLCEVFTFQWLDRGLIDGILHSVARLALGVGPILRNYIDKPVVNGFGDFVGEGTKKLGNRFRVIQTGKVQQYMFMALVLAFGALFYFLFTLKP